MGVGMAEHGTCRQERGREKCRALSVAGLCKGHSCSSFLKCLCFDLPLLIGETKKKDPDVQQPSDLAAQRSALVPLVLTRALLSFSPQGHHLALCALAFWAGTEKLPWACGAAGKVGVPMPRERLKGTGALQKVAQG